MHRDLCFDKGFEHGESHPHNVVKNAFAPNESGAWNADDMYSVSRTKLN